MRRAALAFQARQRYVRAEKFRVRGRIGLINVRYWFTAMGLRLRWLELSGRLFLLRAAAFLRASRRSY